ncbi:dTDP-4-dehydrorhamnose 3,5-epimerase [Parasphingorhabdus sp.]|uniref:dTDP-4-dehydrorhamnose 3,5-epimerase n=1 Tax=Parasphingorhabdus sp. TaxID=2709688 RepID=UPI003A9567D1
MQIDETTLPGVLLLTPKRFSDARGFFSEVYNAAALSLHGIDTVFVQDNHSLSAKAGTVRGLHFQSPPHAQDKLVRVSRGRILDVAVDVRKNSPNYGSWTGIELSADNGSQLLVPKGFLHGFLTLEDNCEVVYKCSDYYAPECDGSVRFDDPDIGIDWGVRASDVTISEKDANAQSFQEFDSPFIC